MIFKNNPKFQCVSFLSAIGLSATFLFFGPAYGQDPGQPQAALLGNPQAPQSGILPPAVTPTPIPSGVPAGAQPAGLPGMDNALLHFQPGQQPVVVPPVTFVDVNSGRFGKLEIDLEEGQFLDASCDHLHMVARHLDVQDGVLKSLQIQVQGGHLQDFIFDSLELATAGDMNFDPGVFLNHRMLQFSQPVQADVTAIISQKSLNSFLNAPKTLDRLSITAGKRANAIASLVGMGGNIGLNVSNADLVLSKQGKVSVTVQTNVGLGLLGGVPINGTIEGRLGLKDGWLDLSDTHMSTGGQEISPDLTNLLIKKVQSISLAAQKSNDLKFTFTDLKVVPNKQIVLKGTAQIMRLRFGG
jgi:hypothetical protein